MTKVRRRDVLLRGMQTVVVFPLLPLVTSRGNAAESCVDPASETLRHSLNYTSSTPKPAEACRACGFFTPREGSTCGPCMIMSGPVDANGHCDSWSSGNQQ